MKKKITSILLATALFLNLALPSFAIEPPMDDSLSAAIDRVSEAYGLPREDVAMLPEAQIRDMDVDPDRVLSTTEQYVKFTTDEQGNTTSEPGTLNEYLSEQIMLAIDDTVEIMTNDWMKFTLTLIDLDGYLGLSARYEWLDDPRVTYETYDSMSLTFENGTFTGDTYAYHWYTLNGDREYDSLSDCKLESSNPSQSNPKSVIYSMPMDDSGTYRDQYFYMYVRVRTNYGAGAERVYGYYAHQTKEVDWEAVLEEVVGTPVSIFTTVLTLPVPPLSLLFLLPSFLFSVI